MTKKRKREEEVNCNNIPPDVIGEIMSYLRPSSRMRFFMINRFYLNFYKNNTCLIKNKEVVFLIDTTRSMDRYIEGAKWKFIDICKNLKKTSRVKMSIIFFNDHLEHISESENETEEDVNDDVEYEEEVNDEVEYEEEVIDEGDEVDDDGGAGENTNIIYLPINTYNTIVRPFGFTEKLRRVVSLLNNVKCYGGGDEPEAFADAFYHLNKLNFDSKFDKYVFLLSDSYPHGLNKNDNTFDNFPQGCPCGIKWKDEVKKIAKIKRLKFFFINCCDNSGEAGRTVRNIIKFKKKMSNYLGSKMKVVSYDDLQNKGMQIIT
jgi:hypothetical protein